MRIYPAYLLAALAVVATGCKSGDAEKSASAANKPVPHVKDLVIEDTVKGTGDAAARGDDVWVLYTGKLTNGTVFDTNKKKDGKSFHLTLGAGQVIKGWDEGLLGMKKGGHRHLVIPYAMAYGDKPNPGIPPQSDLVFDVEMQDILKQNEQGVINASDTKVGKGREAKKGDTVTVDYDATANGESFDTQKNISFKIGEEMQVPGFDTAITGMKVGGQRVIKIPPSLTRSIASEKLGMNVAVYTVTLKSVK